MRYETILIKLRVVLRWLDDVFFQPIFPGTHIKCCSSLLQRYTPLGTPPLPPPHSAQFAFVSYGAGAVDRNGERPDAIDTGRDHVTPAAACR